MALKKMKDICLKIGSGATPRGGKKAYIDSGISLIRSQNVLDFRFSCDGLAHINEQQANKLNNVIVENGDVLLNITGDSVARVCIVEDDILPARVNQHVAIIRANTDIVLANYLLYFLQMSKPYLLQIAAGGATRNALTKGMLEELELEVPPIGKQEKIVSIIDDLQRKIKQNTEINENLLQQARSLFHQWATGTSSAMSKLSDIAEINPETYSPKDNWSFVNYLDTSSITEGTITEVQYILPSEEKLPSRARRILRKGDIVFSTVRPNQLHYGIIANPMPNMLGSTGFTVIRSKYAAIPNEIIYLALTEASFVEQMQQLAEQSVSTFPSIRPADLDACVLPEPKAEDGDFMEAIKAIFHTIATNDEENQRLAALRDTLLPRLMSGELDVSAIDL